jgi:hypothetical protein
MRHYPLLGAGGLGRNVRASIVCGEGPGCAESSALLVQSPNLTAKSADSAQATPVL